MTPVAWEQGCTQGGVTRVVRSTVPIRLPKLLFWPIVPCPRLTSASWILKLVLELVLNRVLELVLNRVLELDLGLWILESGLGSWI